MSTVILQVGQCGNQIGQQFWKLALKDKASNEGHVYLHPESKLRSVNVDAEPKVIRRLMKETKKSYFRESNVVLGKRGCGTNWAIGYHGVKHEEQSILLESAMESLRKEVERCDRFSGFLTMHSLSGGTGSGLGSHLTECIRDEYPMNFILSCVVAPHITGESPLQHYNALLTVSHLQRYSDGIILFQNDEVLYQLSRRAATVDQAISFMKMNEHIAHSLCGMLLPIDTLTPSSGVSIGMEPWEMLRSVCPMPTLKFASMNHVSRSKVTWEGLTTSLLHSINKYDLKRKPYYSISTLVAARGDKFNSFLPCTKQIEEKIRAAYNCVSWNPFPVDFWVGTRVGTGSANSASLTVAANHSSIIPYLEHITERSQAKYDAKAYLHWFWKHGCTQDDFEQAFECVSTVIDSYHEAR